jgi:hypothetical protein
VRRRIPDSRCSAQFAYRHCEPQGGYSQPASACHVHHTKPKSRGGKTSVKDCLLLCAFHHLIAIHRWGWTLALNGDGTTTAWNKDRTKVLHSHAPPAPGNQVHSQPLLIIAPAAGDYLRGRGGFSAVYPLKCSVPAEGPGCDGRPGGACDIAAQRLT